MNLGMNTETLGWPRCARCDAPVAFVMTAYAPADDAVVVEVRCHNEVERVSIPLAAVRDGDPRTLRLDGDAFAVSAGGHLTVYVSEAEARPAPRRGFWFVEARERRVGEVPLTGIVLDDLTREGGR